MRILSLSIRNLRVITDLRIEPVRDVNWVVGENGAGKTTLLEAIFLLGRGRSFRRSRHGALIREGERELVVSAVVESNEIKRNLSFVLRSGKKKLCVNDKPVSRVRDLSRLLQVRIISENSQMLLESQPEIRRLFMDWNLFHVEPRYADLLESFKRVLLQRNAWLRSGGDGFAVWDTKYLDLAASVTQSRKYFVDQLVRELATIRDILPGLPTIEPRLRQGWPSDRDLRDAVVDSLRSDIKRGYTQYGPSRADFLVFVDGKPGIGSRGQCKLIVSMLQCAAQRVLESAAGSPCIWLLDDLKSEMDLQSHSQISRLFEQMECQSFRTSLESPGSFLPGFDLEGYGVFHVEQGALTENHR